MAAGVSSPIRTRLLAGIAATAVAAACLVQTTAPEASATTRHTGKNPVAVGGGGAVSSVDPEATAIGIDVLRRGGNAADAAVATAAALGVTEPYSAGVGGGGFFLHYDAEHGVVETIDGRETAPLEMPRDAFIDPATGEPYPFFPEMVTSGASVGVPGTPATWQAALDSWGSYSLSDALRPATRLASRGFVVDETFREQTLQNRERFAAIEPTAELFLPGGDAPRVGSTFRNRDLAHTYRLLARKGVDAFYRGPLAREVARTVQNPPTVEGTELPVPAGVLSAGDLARYDVLRPAPTSHDYRGLRVLGMGPPSSGGSTVGETLNILDRFDLGSMPAERALHHYFEASALAYADRGRYLGDAGFVDVPLTELLSDGFAAERACLLDPDQAAVKPVAPGEADGEYDPGCGDVAREPIDRPDHEGPSTTHLSVVDRWGNVVSYTLTIEQTGGSGIVVPDRGFLLNNELTDFSHVYDEEDPNRIEGGKRPRSSMAPTIVLAGGEPWLALGSPGGSTIITTVIQTLINRIDLGMDLPSAVAAPRATQRNTPSALAEQEFTEAYGEALASYGHTFSPAAEIGAVAAVEILPGGLLQAVAEPERRGGGDARVVVPSRPGS
ncbi:gamma-glutamyltransferase [Qaidamihabitans albus]|uniref:gamma-glutamyltransferase n=1 Tax=Qaidamihabitans albus TaxID=2795733 RepID=UPI0018F26BB2|nr:gamma-glutamyltransferase [Qaidamihabitans albus]